MDMAPFDYAKPVLLIFDDGSAMAKGASCFIDCTGDQICPTPADEI